MVPPPSAILIWAFRIPFGEIRCVAWQSDASWIVALYHGEALYAHAAASDFDTACRWSGVIRSELGRLGLDGSESHGRHTFAKVPRPCGAFTDARTRPH